MTDRNVEKKYEREREIERTKIHGKEKKETE